MTMPSHDLRAREKKEQNTEKNGRTKRHQEKRETATSDSDPSTIIFLPPIHPPPLSDLVPRSLLRETCGEGLSTQHW